MAIYTMFPVKYANFLLVLGVLLAISVSCHGAKGSRKRQSTKQGEPICVTMTSTSVDKVLTCPRKSIIYNLDVNSFNSSRQDRKSVCDSGTSTECSGLQPDVLTQSNNCYQKSSCNITISNVMPIVTSHSPQCIGVKPSLLRIKFFCVRKNQFIVLKGEGHRADKGVVVSHEYYPWNYPPGIYEKMTLEPKRKRKKKMFLSVHKLEMNEDDMVYVNAGSHRVNLTGHEMRPLEFQQKSVTITFTTDNNIYTYKGRGFLLCFYWAESNESVPSGSVCDKLQRPRRKKKTKNKKRNKKKKEPKTT